MKNKVLKPNVIRGGTAVPLGANYYYMQGRKHKDGGIDIGPNTKSGLNVEGEEVMHITNKDIKVFSAEPLLNGESPAKKVMGGHNPTKVFNDQEDYKDKNNLNDDGTINNSNKKQNGGKVMNRKKALTGTNKRLNLDNIQDPISVGITGNNVPFSPMSLDRGVNINTPPITTNNTGSTVGNIIRQGVGTIDQYTKDNPWAVGDGIGLASNVIGGIFANRANSKMLDNLTYSDQPTTRKATKLKTQININPQLDKMRETLSAYERDIDNNTASSRVALARKQRGRLAGMMQTNELYGNKENIETQLVNNDRLNQQEVNNTNVADYNRWSEGKAAFNNAVTEKKSENTIGLIDNINSGVQDVIGRSEKRYANRQNALTMASAYPNVNPRILKDMGVRGITDKMIDAYDKAYGKNKNKDK